MESARRSYIERDIGTMFYGLSWGLLSGIFFPDISVESDVFLGAGASVIRRYMNNFEGKRGDLFNDAVHGMSFVIGKEIFRYLVGGVEAFN